MRICLACNRRDEDDVAPECAACGESSWMTFEQEPREPLQETSDLARGVRDRG